MNTTEGNYFILELYEVQMNSRITWTINIKTSQVSNILANDSFCDRYTSSEKLENGNASMVELQLRTRENIPYLINSYPIVIS